MSARWVAGTARARAMLTRRLGSAGARALATLPYHEAVRRLAAGPYGHDVHPGQDVLTAQRCIGATLLWHLRVLAGWLPQEGGEALRRLAGWFEVVNVEGHLRAMDGDPAPAPYTLGMLATAWPRLAGTPSREQLRAELAASPWGDPGAGDDRSVALTMRMGAATRVAGALAPAADWARSAALLLLTREVLLRERPLPDAGLRQVRRLLGVDLTAVTSLDGLRAVIPRSVRWVLDGVDGPATLWRAEIDWWRRVERDATAMAGTSRPGLAPVLGTVALLGVDAWRVRAGLGAAYRATPGGAFDEVV